MLTKDIYNFTTGLDVYYEKAKDVVLDKVKYHRVIIQQESNFMPDTLRIVNIAVRQGIRTIVGTQKEGESLAIQAYLFSAEKWDIEQVKEWIDAHGIDYLEMQEDTEVNITEPISKLENIIKFDKQKQIVYGVFLVPEKADHDGDVISAEDIEKVAHDFLVEYRTIDEMHKDVIEAEIIESAIAWVDKLDYYGKELSKGTWFGAIHVSDKGVWNKIVNGEYRAFSVRIAGVREVIKEGAKI